MLIGDDMFVLSVDSVAVSSKMDLSVGGDQFEFESCPDSKVEEREGH